MNQSPVPTPDTIAESEATKSPSGTPKPSNKPMSFGDAMKVIADGGRITKLEWKNKEYYGVLQNTILTLHKPDGKFYPWKVNEGDLIGTDFIVI